MNTNWVILWFFINLTLTGCQQFPKKLWVYWQQNYEQNQKVKIFIQKFRQNLQPDNWQIYNLNKTTVVPYMDLQDLKFFKLQHKADYIRTLLITYYGGVWIDVSSVLVEDFQWMKISNMLKNPDIQNKYGNEPDVLFFSNQDYGTKQKYFDLQTNTNYTVSPGYQIWFIAVKPNSTFMRRFIQQYHKGLIQFTHFTMSRNNYISTLSRRYNISQGLLTDNQYMCTLQIIQYILQRKQKELDSQIGFNGTGPRKLAVWYYKIWHINAIQGPFSIFLRYHVLQSNILFHYSRQKLQKLGFKFKYFFKLIGDDRRQSQRFYYQVKQQDSQNLTQIAKVVQAVKLEEVQKFFCPQQFQIHEQSLLYQYLLKNNPEKPANIQAVPYPYRPIHSCSILRKFKHMLKKSRHPQNSPILELLQQIKNPKEDIYRNNNNIYLSLLWEIRVLILASLILLVVINFVSKRIEKTFKQNQIWVKVENLTEDKGVDFSD